MSATSLDARVSFPPLRTLDDFLLCSARFQLPSFTDLNKWGNRVIKNLLYYQSNYFLLVLAIYSLMIIFHPLSIIIGLAVQSCLIAVFLHFFHMEPKYKELLKMNPKTPKDRIAGREKWYYLIGALLVGYILLYCIDALLLSSFALFFSITLIFIHSSLRLRNIKNKVVNTMESITPTTPMGYFLDTIKDAADGFFVK